MALDNSEFKVDQRLSRQPYFWLLVGLLSLACVLFFAVFLPMTQRVSTLASSISETKTNLRQAGISDLDLSRGLHQMAAFELEELADLSERLNRQIEFHPDPDAILAAPFRVLEFEQRRFMLFRELINQAELSDVELPSQIISMLPAYTTEEAYPARLALRLEFVTHVLKALLMNAGSLELIEIEVLPDRIFEMDLKAQALLEFRLRLQLKGHVNRLIPFLAASRPEDEAASLSTGYFIDHFLFDNSKTEDSGITHLEVQLSGFVKTTARGDE